jgi:hypothetical protein
VAARLDARVNFRDLAARFGRVVCIQGCQSWRSTSYVEHVQESLRL